MALKRYCTIALVAIMAMVLAMGSPTVMAQESSPDLSPGLHTGWMMETYDGYNGTWSCNRTYEYYIPSGYDGSEAVPLLFSFHGIGSNGPEQEDLTKFDVLAEQEGFIAVFPNATTLTADDNPCAGNLIGKYNPLLAGADLTQWNLGINWSLQYCAGVDDVEFVSDIIDSIETNYNIDASQIYATGMSLGAFFSHYVALMLPGTFAAIAPVCGPMLVNMLESEDVPPLTVIMMMSPTDPIVPYYGDDTGTIRPMDETIAFWLDVDNITSTPVTTVWGPTASDNTTVTQYVYSGGTDGTQVVFFKVEGCKTENYWEYCAGHTWPGGPQYLDPLFIGLVTTQIDGTAQIWRYLPPEKHYLTIYSSSWGSVAAPGQETFANVNSAGAYMFFDPGTGDTVVDLMATPESGYGFVNWTGDVSTVADINSATTSITITPDDDYGIMANFIAQYDLTIDSTDGGQVTAPGEGVFPDYDAGTLVNLVATPDAGYQFLEWTGDVTEIDDRYAAETTITMEDNYTITASFEEEPSGGMCFIATAAYGTAAGKELDFLREFRDDVLLDSTIGSQLVGLYYQISPPIADFMSEDIFVRTLIRELLIDPIIWVVEATKDIWGN